MSKKRDELSPLVRALIPPEPGEIEKRELHEQVGRAIVELSSAENLLALIFCVLSAPATYEKSKKMFASQGSFEKKLDLVDFVVRMNGKVSEIDLWSGICVDLHNCRAVRNILAHQRMLVKSNDESPEVEVSLVPLFYKTNGKSLRTKEIRKSADELEDVTARLWKFITSINRQE